MSPLYFINNTTTMDFLKKNTSVLCCLFIVWMVPTLGKTQDDSWRERMKELIYTPRYFGPNAFPLPELRSGRIGAFWELEVRGEYHEYQGDRTKDIYTRAFVPIAEGRAGLEVSYVLYEYYYMTQATVEERHAAGPSWKNGAHGDVIVSFFIQALQNEKWIDIMFEGTLKTASGNRLADARYTDAASYWFAAHAGRYLYHHNNAYIRLQGFAGFYCWMTNDLVHRQNDAITSSAGLSGSLKGFTIDANFVNLYGYKNNGDRPVQLRTRLNYEYRKNILSVRFKHGLKDALYNSYSLAYIRRF